MTRDAVPTPHPGEWTIVERDETAAIRAALHRSPARLQVLVGPAGVGKSVLARGVTNDMVDRVVIPVLASAELSDVPLAALAPALAQLRLPTDPSGAVLAFVSAVARDPDRHVLLVDDAPRLDAVSAGAIAQLVRGFGVAAVATARLGERLPDSLARLADEGFAEIRHLGGLSHEAVEQILTARFGTHVRHADVARLATRTDGNPLYLRALVEAAERDGAVRVERGLVAIDDGRTPPDLLAAVAERVSAVDADTARLLRAIALMEPVDRDTVAPGSEPALDALMVGGLVRFDPGSTRLRTSHPLIGEVARARADVADVERAAATLASTGLAPDRFAAVRLRRGTPGGAPPAEVAWAAGHARASGDLPAAAELAAHALAAGGLDDSVRFDTLLTSAVARSGTGDLDGADLDFARASELASDATQSVLLASLRGEHLAYRRGDVAAAVAQAVDVRHAVPDEVAVTLDADLTIWRAILGHAAAAGPDAGNAPESPDLAVRAAMAAVMTDSMGGRHAEARAWAEVLASVQARHGVLEPFAAAMLGHQRYFDLLAGGEGDAAAAFVEERRAATADAGIGVWTYTLGIHRMYNGRLGEAERLATLAMDQLSSRDGIGLLPAALALRACVAAHRGDHDLARTRLAELGPEQRAEPKAAMLLAETAALLAAGDGELAAAVTMLEHAAEGARSVGYHLVGAITIALAIRLGHADRALPVLARIHADVPPGLGLYEALLDLARALVGRDVDGVARSAARVAAAGMAPVALDALVLARRLPAGAESRRRVELASLAIGRGVDAPSLQAREPPVLTRREREVAVAAAARQRSREIAERLGVSVRTVENQLSSVYRKLGVSSRDELRDALDESGLIP